MPFTAESFRRAITGSYAVEARHAHSHQTPAARGLVLHHRRHPTEHPRRLVNRTASWEDPPVNGVCRWCYELTASPQTRWHRYCLNAYRVALGQHPDEIQHTLCEICGNPSDEMDRRLAIEVARALGPTAMLRPALPAQSRAGTRSGPGRQRQQRDCSE